MEETELSFGIDWIINTVDSFATARANSSVVPQAVTMSLNCTLLLQLGPFDTPFARFCPQDKAAVASALSKHWRKPDVMMWCHIGAQKQNLVA